MNPDLPNPNPEHSLWLEFLIILVGVAVGVGAVVLLLLASGCATSPAAGIGDLHQRIHERIIKLRNGETRKVIFGRIAHQLDRSKVRMVKHATGALPANTVWRIGPILDQGSEGSCVGHGCVAGLNASPAAATPALDHTYARETVYWGAQRRDPWPGGAYPGARPQYEGCTVQAGVDELLVLGWADSAEWAATGDEVITALATKGPVIVGTTWYDGMNTPDANGYIHPTGEAIGGHCYLLWQSEITSGTSASNAEGTVWLQNSWSDGWGDRGTAKISIRELRTLFADGTAEAAVLIGKHTAVAPADPGADSSGGFWSWFSNLFGKGK